MSQLVPSIPLASVTADQIRLELINRIKVFFPDWTDQLDSNNMIVLIELLSMLAELDYAYMDRRARESFIQYALDPTNIYAHAWGLGYLPAFQTPAMVTAELKLNNPVTANTLVPIGTKVPTILPGIVYETTTPYTIPTGQDTIEVELTQWESYTKEFSGNGTPFQKILLTNTPVIPSSIEVVIDGVTWTQVDSFVESLATDTHYRIIPRPDGSVQVMCGNGVSGRLFEGEAGGSIDFKTGGGKAGNIGPYMLGLVTSEIRDAGTNAVLSIQAYNALASTPGVDMETPEQVRYQATKSVRKSKVLLDLPDIESEVLRVPGVVATKAVNWTIEPSLSRYMVQVFVAPEGLGTPDPALLANVVDAISVAKQTVMGTVPIVMPADYRELEFNIALHVKAGYDFNTVSQALHQKLLDLFDPTMTNIWGFIPAFGMSIYSSVLVAILQQVDGVRNLTMTTPGDTELDFNEFPVVSRLDTYDGSGLTWSTFGGV